MPRMVGLGIGAILRCIAGARRCRRSTTARNHASQHGVTRSPHQRNRQCKSHSAHLTVEPLSAASTPTAMHGRACASDGVVTRANFGGALNACHSAQPSQAWSVFRCSQVVVFAPLRRSDGQATTIAVEDGDVSMKKKPSLPYGTLASSLFDASHHAKDEKAPIPVPGPTPHLDPQCLRTTANPSVNSSVH